MPYATNNPVRIHYEVEGDGPPVVLQHGFTSSIDGWYRNGYVDALKGSYQLILVNARGHGRSDKPHESAAYAYERRAEDVLTVLDDLGVARAHYVGYSMGGRIGYALAQHWLDRFLSLAIGGAAPYSRDPSDAQRRYIEPFRQGMAHHLAQAEATTGPFPEWRKAELLANDPEALIAAALAGPWEPSRGAMLPKIDVTCLLYVGESDDLACEGMKCASASSCRVTPRERTEGARGGLALGHQLLELGALNLGQLQPIHLHGS